MEQFRQKHPLLVEIIETIAFVIVAVIFIRFFLVEIRWIPSGSMIPTLLEGDRIFVEKVTRFYKTPERGYFIPHSLNLITLSLVFLKD